MKKRIWAAWMAGIALLSVAGCQGKGATSASPAAEMPAEASIAYDSASYNAQDPMEEAGGGAYDAGASVTSENGIEAVAAAGRKLIRTVRLEMQTKEFDAVLEGLGRNVQEMGGYVESSSIRGGGYDYSGGMRGAAYTLRIPSNRLDEFVEVVNGLGNVTYKNESVEDVTLQYVDVESHKKVLETEQARLLELMEQAESLEDLLAIEGRLSEVRYELETYGSQMRLLDNQIDYSMVYVDIMEAERLTQTGERSFLEEIADRFRDSLYSVRSGLRELVIVVLGSLPILAVWAVVIAVCAAVIRKLFYRREKKEKKARRWWKKNQPSESQDPESPDAQR